MNTIRSRRSWCAFSLITLIASTVVAQAPEMPAPTKQHDLLKQFAGEWTVVAETVPPPGGEAFRIEGTESARMVGGFWLVGEGKSEMMGMPMQSCLTLGYDPKTEKFIGTFYCSADSTLWKYAGTMSESGKVLTLETEGPSMLDPSKTAKYREVLELLDAGHKRFTSSTQGDDGSWQKIVTMDYRRKK